MRLRADRDAIGDAVAWAAHGVAIRPSLPVLAGMRLSFEDGRLTVAGYDYEVSSEAVVDAEGESGETVVSGRLLAEIVKSLPNKPVELTVESTRAELRCGGGRFVLPTMPAEDYPILPTLPPYAGSVDGAAFAEAVARVVPAASRDETIPLLTGLHLELSGERLSLLTTDRYRVAWSELPWQPADPAVDRDVLVPARTLAGIVKPLSGGGDLAVSVAEPDGAPVGLIGLTTAGRRATSRVLDGRPPNVRAQFDLAFGPEARVSTARLREVVRRVALVTQRQSRLRLEIRPGELLVAAGSGEDAEASEPMECDYQGPVLRLAFHTGYLLDGLAAVDAPVTVLAPDSGASRVRITGATAEESDTTDHSGKRYLTVPLREPA